MWSNNFYDMMLSTEVQQCHMIEYFQELFELAQRKLLRQLTLYAENQDIDIYPRLFLVDFVKDQISDSEMSDPEVTENLPTGMCFFFFFFFFIIWRGSGQSGREGVLL